VEITAPYFVASPEQRVQVIGDREMASGQAIAVAAGEFEDELRGPAGIGAVAGLELAADPAEHAPFRRVWLGGAHQGCVAETDRQQARIDAEHRYAVLDGLRGERLRQLDQRGLRGHVR
jgi:hypothetical protein